MDPKLTQHGSQTTDTESRHEDPLESSARLDPNDPFALSDHGEAALSDDQLQGITAGSCVFRCIQK